MASGAGRARSPPLMLRWLMTAALTAAVVPAQTIIDSVRGGSVVCTKTGAARARISPLGSWNLQESFRMLAANHEHYAMCIPWIEVQLVHVT